MPLGLALVDTLRVHGLIEGGFPAIEAFLERVLHETIEDDMRPLEPSIPPWIPGHWP